MGHNRGGDDAKAKKKRRLRQDKRVAAKRALGGQTAVAPAPREKPAGGILAKAKSLVEKATHAVTDAVKAGVEKIKGHE